MLVSVYSFSGYRTGCAGCCLNVFGTRTFPACIRSLINIVYMLKVVDITFKQRYFNIISWCVYLLELRGCEQNAPRDIDQRMYKCKRKITDTFYLKTKTNLYGIKMQTAGLWNGMFSMPRIVTIYTQEKCNSPNTLSVVTVPRGYVDRIIRWHPTDNDQAVVKQWRTPDRRTFSVDISESSAGADDNYGDCARGRIWPVGRLRKGVSRPLPTFLDLADLVQVIH